MKCKPEYQSTIECAHFDKNKMCCNFHPSWRGWGRGGGKASHTDFLGGGIPFTATSSLRLLFLPGRAMLLVPAERPKIMDARLIVTAERKAKTKEVGCNKRNKPSSAALRTY